MSLKSLGSLRTNSKESLASILKQRAPQSVTFDHLFKLDKSAAEVLEVLKLCETHSERLTFNLFINGAICMAEFLNNFDKAYLPDLLASLILTTDEVSCKL
jgi:hypothetical protein